jgi:hypothetical protein
MKKLLNEREVTQEVERHLRYTSSEFVDRVMASAEKPAPAWRRGLRVGIPALAAQGLAAAVVAVVAVALVVSLRHSAPTTGSAKTNVNNPAITALATTAPSSAPRATGSTPTPIAGVVIPGTHATSPPANHAPSTPESQSSSAPGGGSTVVILGDTSKEAKDSNLAGTAEAFQFSATSSGTLQSMSIYVDSGSTGKVIVGIYSANGSHPGSLLTSATLNSPATGTWNTLNVPSVTLQSGQQYWIALLSPNGTLHFLDSVGEQIQTCPSETDSNTSLTALPATWATGRSFNDCPVSAYGQS